MLNNLHISKALHAAATTLTSLSIYQLDVVRPGVLLRWNAWNRPCAQSVSASKLLDLVYLVFLPSTFHVYYRELSFLSFAMFTSSYYSCPLPKNTLQL